MALPPPAPPYTAHMVIFTRSGRGERTVLGLRGCGSNRRYFKCLNTSRILDYEDKLFLLSKKSSIKHFYVRVKVTAKFGDAWN